MLSIPSVGFNRSVNKNNIAFDLLGDWIEASVMFGDDDVSKTDICLLYTSPSPRD